MKEEDDSEDDEDYDKEKLTHKAKVPLTPEWERIDEVRGFLCFSAGALMLETDAKKIGWLKISLFIT